MNENLLSITWNNHSSVLTYNIDKFFRKESHCDATLICERKQIKVHRIVLAACSEYFRELFDDIFCLHPYIILKDIALSELEALLEYMYNGKTRIFNTRFSKFINAADYFRVQGLSVSDNEISSNVKITSVNSDNVSNSWSTPVSLNTESISDPEDEDMEEDKITKEIGNTNFSMEIDTNKPKLFNGSTGLKKTSINSTKKVQRSDNHKIFNTSHKDKPKTLVSCLDKEKLKTFDSCLNKEKPKTLVSCLDKEKPKTLASCLDKEKQKTLVSCWNKEKSKTLVSSLDKEKPKMLPSLPDKGKLKALASYPHKEKPKTLGQDKEESKTLCQDKEEPRTSCQDKENFSRKAVILLNRSEHLNKGNSSILKDNTISVKMKVSETTSLLSEKDESDHHRISPSGNISSSEVPEEHKETEIPPNVGVCDKSNLNRKPNFNGERFHHNCNICGFSTEYLTQLSAHMKTHNVQPSKTLKRLKCTVCPFSTLLKPNLNRHLKSHVKPLKCKKCSFRASLNISMKKHEETCKRGVVIPKDIENDMASEEDEDMLPDITEPAKEASPPLEPFGKDYFQCAFCSHKTSSEALLTSHVKKAH